MIIWKANQTTTLLRFYSERLGKLYSADHVKKYHQLCDEGRPRWRALKTRNSLLGLLMKHFRWWREILVGRYQTTKRQLWKMKFKNEGPISMSRCFATLRPSLKWKGAETGQKGKGSHQHESD